MVYSMLNDYKLSAAIVRYSVLSTGEKKKDNQELRLLLDTQILKCLVVLDAKATYFFLRSEYPRRCL